MLVVSERESPSVPNRQLMRSLAKIHWKHVKRKKWIVIFRGPILNPLFLVSSGCWEVKLEFKIRWCPRKKYIWKFPLSLASETTQVNQKLWKSCRAETIYADTHCNKKRKISIKVVDKPFPIVPFVFDTSVCPLLASFERPITTATGATIIENENIIVIFFRRLIIFKILNSV